MRSHGSTWNSALLRVGQMNIGDHLTPAGMRTALCDQTYVFVRAILALVRDGIRVGVASNRR